MFESKLNRGRANGYAPLDDTGKVPLDKLPPIQSTINTGSFATTGSNTFFGEQTVSGSLLLAGNIRGALALVDNVEIFTSQINFVSNSSGEPGSNLSTIQLVPDVNSPSADQMLVIDPTFGFPNHIHLRPGGEMDNSSTSIILGGESSNVSVVGGQNPPVLVTANNYVWQFETNGTILFPDYTVQTTAFTGIDSSSFATTGSNQFSGSQTITGSLNISDELTFTNSASIQLTSTLAIASPSTGIPNSVSNWNGQGGWNQMFYSNISTTGGTGIGLTVDVAAGSGGYIGIETISINTPGSGYTDGDVITIDNENNLPGTFTIGTAVGDSWTFDTNGSLSTPGDIDVNGRLSIITPDPATDFTTIDFRNIDDFGIYGKTNSINARGNTLEFTATDYNINGDVVTHEVLTLRPEGNVGIGTNNPSNTLEVNGGVTATSFTGSLQGTASSALNTQLFDGKNITEFGTKVTGSWTVLPGTFNYSITLDPNSTYQMWILGNIPNGIVKYNANVTTSNTNVPVLGTHSAWNYVEGGSPILITSLPRQIVGVDGTISTSSPNALGASTNVFSFGIQNNTTGSVVVNYGYVKLS